jgi:hypothetical protein
MSSLAVNKFFSKGSWGRVYIVTLIFLLFASALFWLDFFRAYKTEMSILFVTKNEKISAPVVASSLSSIMQTLAFAERAQKDAGTTSFFPEALSRDAKRAYWNNNLEITTQDGSGVLVFSQKAKSSEEAQEKADATLATTLLSTNLYYGEGYDVEVRVIDRQVTTVTVQNTVWYILVSLATAFAITTFFFGLLMALSARKKSYEGSSLVSDHIGESVAWINPEKFVAVRPTTLSYQEPVVEEVVVVKETIVTPKAKKVAAAPGNLPIMEGALPQFGILEAQEIHQQDADAIPEPVLIEEIKHEPITIQKNTEEEPTVEEYKRRLNELLKGNTLS